LLRRPEVYRSKISGVSYPRLTEARRMSLCKKHKKPKDELVIERQEHGGVLKYPGCIDCKMEALTRPRAAKRETKVKSHWRRWFP
jgi:hypothetical protein